MGNLLESVNPCKGGDKVDQVPFGISALSQADIFAENPEPRVPCLLVLDVSQSMSGDPIRQLNEGLNSFKEELMSDPLASKRVEPAIITFGAEVRLTTDFGTADTFIPPMLSTSGSTPMGAAMSLAMDSIKVRKELYRANGIAYYRPWIFLISDGAPTDEWQHVALRAVQAQNEKAFSLFSVGVQGADLETLSKFSTRTPLSLNGLRFREMFVWLSGSLKQVSRSSPGDAVPLTNPTTPDGWAIA
jgi:uncharacterized protein YegL